MKFKSMVIRIVFLALFVFVISKGNMMIWLAFFAVSLLAALIFGRVYCGYACPMNTVMLASEWISKKLKLQKDAPKWMEKGIYPWIFLGLSVVLMAAAKKAVQINLPVLIIWTVISFVLTLVYKPYVFHNLICPFGALQKLFGRRPLFSKEVSEDACIGCAKCEKACPSAAIKVNENKKAVIEKSLCHQCENCAVVCPTDAIKYKKQG